MAIADSAFELYPLLTFVRIPDTVKTIGNRAFAECVLLKEIKIPDSVTSIGGGAFKDCSSLTIYCEAESKPEDWYSM